MNDVEVKKRGWVKNAALVFLSIMLILTFFSNDIMNRSLPECAAQFTQASTITARIRGSGTVVANELYEIKTTQAHTVGEVRAKVGDEVSTGDVLIVLSKSSSEELEAKEEELHKAELDLERYLISDNPDNSYREYNLAIQNARNELTGAQEDRARAENELAQAQHNRDAIGFDEAAYNRAISNIESARITRDRRKTEEDDAVRRLKDFELRYGYWVDPNTGIVYWDPSITDPDVIDRLESERQGLVSSRDEAIRRNTDAQRALDRLETDSRNAALILAEPRWNEANSKVTAASNALTAADRAVVSAQQALSSANAALSDAQKAGSVTNSLFDLEVKEKERIIKDLREQIEELKREGSSTEITAPVSGKITQVNISPGKQTVPDEPLLIIEVVDMGYTVSIEATNNQSSRVRVGDTADVDRGYWSQENPLTAVLTSIRPNPENPQAGRLLVFSISGENIESGSQLNIVMAQRSENYGIVVPNSAIRTDTNGDFVLAVETRSTPLRNRYIAIRIDVTILASDDTNTAISGGGLTGHDFVITTSSRPIEPGMQVRLVDNP